MRSGYLETVLDLCEAAERAQEVLTVLSLNEAHQDTNTRLQVVRAIPAGDQPVKTKWRGRPLKLPTAAALILLCQSNGFCGI